MDWVSGDARAAYRLLNASFSIESFRQLEEREPDCFKDTARILHRGCRSLTATTYDKVQYAVLLTVCELSTANLPVPRECYLPQKRQQCIT
ncbi:hypothetical protein BJV82DRAFT_98164 [Fennellomyces sp. T-0311]|nr:hypothetical protein BJV82DRAFT_98164 [Fennellomyces sp. T-0311]